MRPFLVLSMAVAGVIATPKAGSVRPLDNTEEFLVGEFYMPEKPLVEGPIPARLSALPRDQSALPKGVWLRFQNLGVERYKDWSAQMQIDDQGNIYLVTHLGDSTADKLKKPAWPAKPQQKLDAATLAETRKEAVAFTTGPAYRAHGGLSYAPIFVVTIHCDSGDKEFFVEGYENDFIGRLRRTTIFAHATPLDGKVDKTKPDKSKPDKPASKPPARKP